jgi:hypothetical protein
MTAEVQQQRQTGGIRPVEVVQQEDKRTPFGDSVQERVDRAEYP